MWQRVAFEWVGMWMQAQRVTAGGQATQESLQQCFHQDSQFLVFLRGLIVAECSHCRHCQPQCHYYHQMLKHQSPNRVGVARNVQGVDVYRPHHAGTMHLRHAPLVVQMMMVVPLHHTLRLHPSSCDEFACVWGPMGV